MKKKVFGIGLICLALLLGQPGLYGPFTASAAETKGETTYELPLMTADSSLSGSVTSRQDYIQLPAHWAVRGATLNLVYQVSQLAQEDRSSITLEMNGISFYSFRPDPEEEGKQRVTVEIPSELLVKGVNTLTVLGNVMTLIGDELCLPEENKDNWLVLYNSSSVNVRYAADPLTGTINNFHERFTSLDSMGKELNAIGVPEQALPAELEAAVHALSGYAKSNSQQDKSIPLMAFQSSGMPNKGLVTAVALFDRLPESIKSELGNPDLDGKALMRLVKQGEQWVLVITAKEEELLVKAGRLAANHQLMSQLEGESKWIDAETDVATPPVEVNQTIALTENGDKLTGSRHQEKSYFVSLPANRSITDASKISLDFRYAKNLDFDRSMVTVLINDTPIGSKKLTEELADGDQLTLTVPKNLDISGNFSVVVAFDLELKYAGCVQNQGHMPWAFVAEDSVLQINTKDRTELLFNNYPYPFLRDGVFNQVAVVLPSEQDAYSYLSISNLFNLLGQYAEGNTGNVTFYTDEVTDDVLKSRNIIAIGSYHGNKVIRNVNDKLYFKYDSQGIGFQSNEKMSIDSDYGKRIGTLQLMESPFEAGLGFMAVTGAEPEYTYLASKLIASQQTMWRVFGDGVTTDRDGSINAFRFKKQAELNQPTGLSGLTERTDVLAFALAAGLVLLLVVVSLILLLRKYYKKRGDRNET